MITFPQHTYMFIYSTTDLGKINVVTSNSIPLSHFPCRISVRVLRRRRRGGRAQQQVQHRPGGAGGADQGQQDYREADQEGQAEVQVKKIRKKHHFDPCSSSPLCNDRRRFSSNFDYPPGLAFCISEGRGGGVQALCIIAPNLLLPFLHGWSFRSGIQTHGGHFWRQVLLASGGRTKGSSRSRQTYIGKVIVL